MTIDLHIDRLILSGFASIDREQLVVAVEQELSRLLAEDGTPAGWSVSGFAAHLDGGSFALTPDMSAESIGTQVARAIYGGIVVP
jgi:hypothetical protein